MQQRIDQIISELLALKEELKNHTNEQTTEPQINQPTEPQIEPQNEHLVRRRTNRSFPLNRSKFLNEEQRDQVLQFASDNKDTIMNQPRTNRIHFFQNLVYERLIINLSL